MGILLPRDQYWDIPEEIKLNILETTEFQDKNKGKIQEPSKTDNEIQAVKRNKEKGKKEIKEIVLGIYQ